jgi:Uncharacterized protein conserved in bacteria (DUF2313).
MLIEYIPNFLRDIEEYIVLFNSLDITVEHLSDGIYYAIDQASILNCNEQRIKEWESFLKITPVGNLYQRRLYIIATLTTVGKLNKAKIEEIVNIYTNGGGAIISFHNSTIYIKVKPPDNGEVFLFPDIERTLNIMKPAHLLLSVTRYYATIGMIEDSFDKVSDVEAYFNTINDVELWLGVKE